MADEARPQWDESQYIMGLAHLEKVQNHLDELRLTIPSIVQTLSGRHNSPEELFKDFKRILSESRKRLTDFNAIWSSGETQMLFKNAQQSRHAQPDLSVDFPVPRRGWIEEAGKLQLLVESQKGQSSIESGTIQSSAVTPEADIDGMVTAFKSAHPKIQVETVSPDHVFKIRLRAAGWPMTFVVERKIDKRVTVGWTATLLETSVLYESVKRSIASRPHQDDLRYLLEMIAAYTDLGKSNCARCGKLLDNYAVRPSARRKNSNTHEEGANVWESYHESCLGSREAFE